MVGILRQRLTKSQRFSPLTFGTSSGAWLAVGLGAVFFPDLGIENSNIFALFGALLAMALVLLITGLNNLSGLPVILAGMAVNLVLGALATAVILLNDQYAKNLVIWGAGDLAQNGWDWVYWLIPRMLVGLIILAVAPRVLTLMRIGQQGASARGLNIMPVFLLLLLVGVWLISSAITAVGVIGFVGLLTPNIARFLGARTARDELYYSCLLFTSDAADERSTVVHGYAPHFTGVNTQRIIILLMHSDLHLHINSIPHVCVHDRHCIHIRRDVYQ